MKISRKQLVLLEQLLLREKDRQSEARPIASEVQELEQTLRTVQTALTATMSDSYIVPMETKHVVGQ